MKKAGLFLLLTWQSLVAVADTDPLYLDAERYYKQQRFDSAVIGFGDIIALYPEKKEGYYNRGLSFYHLNKYTRAIDDFDRCLQIDSHFLDAQYMKALALQKKGNVREAIAELEGLRSRNKDYDEVEKRIKNYRFAVYISETWYYMIAILLLFIVLIAIVAKSVSYRKW